MAKTGVTFDQVKEILDETPGLSTKEIRERLQTGSMGTLTKHRQRWLQEAHVRPEVGAEWPRQIAGIVDEVLAQVRAQRESFVAEIETLRKDLAHLAEENETLSDRFEASEAESVRSLRESEQARRELARAEVRLEEYPVRITTFEAALADERERSRAFEVRAGVLQAEVERLEKSLAEAKNTPELHAIPVQLTGDRMRLTARAGEEVVDPGLKQDHFSQPS